MVRLFAKMLLIYCLTLGILLPQASAALAALGLSSDRIIVICTGDGLRTIALDDDGEPLDLSDDPGHCALVGALDTSADPASATATLNYLYDNEPLVHAPQTFFQNAEKHTLPRAPPAL